MPLTGAATAPTEMKQPLDLATVLARLASLGRHFPAVFTERAAGDPGNDPLRPAAVRAGFWRGQAGPAAGRVGGAVEAGTDVAAGGTRHRGRLSAGRAERPLISAGGDSPVFAADDARFLAGRLLVAAGVAERGPASVSACGGSGATAPLAGFGEGAVVAVAADSEPFDRVSEPDGALAVRTLRSGDTRGAGVVEPVDQEHSPR